MSFFQGNVQDLVQSMISVARYAGATGSVQTCHQLLEELKTFSRSNVFELDVDRHLVDMAVSEIDGIYTSLTRGPQQFDFSQEADSFFREFYYQELPFEDIGNVSQPEPSPVPVEVPPVVVVYDISSDDDEDDDDEFPVYYISSDEEEMERVTKRSSRYYRSEDEDDEDYEEN